MGRETGQPAAEGEIILQDIEGGRVEHEPGQEVLLPLVAVDLGGDSLDEVELDLLVGHRDDDGEQQ